MKKYNPKVIEPKWQKYWEDHKTFEVKEDVKKEKFYGLIEFPYPSGAGLHVGHPRSYTAMDVISRKRRMEGYNVLYPIGFDAFGLPTENYAIKTGRAPHEVTEENIANFTRQLKSLGFSFDWSRAVDTTDPGYYKWTQWIFLKFFEYGLAYKKKQPINWCPKDKIGLANEEVVNGCCERCGGPVEKRDKEQWMLAITKYADSLLEGLKEVDYIERAKVQQENWIGRSEGLIFTAPVKDMNVTIETFSAHFEACYADTFVVIAPDHPLLPTLVAGLPNEEEVIAMSKKILEKRSRLGFEEEKESEGVFTGRYVVDPLGNGNLPIWIASYALVDYGTGIVKCSAHDERDFAFAKKYNIALKPVLFPEDEILKKKVEALEECYTDMKKGVLSEPATFAGKRAGDVRQEILTFLTSRGFATPKVQYKLRDWVFSRQRYWGEPIPLVYCDTCAKNKKFESKGEEMNPGWVPLTEKELPLELPKVEKYQPTDTGESPLAAMQDWVKTECPRCGGPARRETDTMPNWAGSSWYFLRYMDPQNKKAFAGKEIMEYWAPVNWYTGGMEHTVLHLLYSRFWNQFLYDIGLVPTREPYAKRTSHGLVLAEGGEKMSKSKGNVVNPDEIVEKFGADILRTYIMFMGPFDQPVAWDTQGMAGVRRFLDRVWNLYENVEGNTDDKNIISMLHATTQKVSEDIDAMRFNTAISKMMELTNELMKQERASTTAYKTLLKLLSPFAPHMTEELWSVVGEKKTIAFAPWPTFDPALVAADRFILAIQVNGKLRDTIEVDASIDEETAKQQALSSEKIQKWLEGKEPKKVIYVKGKLVSIVA